MNLTEYFLFNLLIGWGGLMVEPAYASLTVEHAYASFWSST